MLILVVAMVTRNEFLMFIFNATPRQHICLYIDHQKLFASLSFITKQYKMQNLLIKSVKIQSS